MIKRVLLFIVLLSGLLSPACIVENMEDQVDIPKTDYSRFNYVLAAEDASTEDITIFFTFNLDEVNPEKMYDLIGSTDIFVNSNPSVSSGYYALNQYFFSLAKDKKGYSSTPGLYRLTLNKDNRVFIEQNLSISKNNLFPARQLIIVNPHLGYFYDEGKEAYKIQMFDPSRMVLLGSVDLQPLIESFRPDAEWADETGNNLVRTGSLVLDHKQGELYVSIVFLEAAGFNLIADEETRFYLAVIDMQSSTAEKIIAYEGAKTVGFFVSENKATTVDEDGNMYFCSWGWNQFNEHTPSKIFRIRKSETEFDTDWVIEIEKLFGPKRIAQSIISYNNRIYLHISNNPYTFSDDSPAEVEMYYYEFDPAVPDAAKKLDIPASNSSPRMNVFSIADDKLFIAVPNMEKGKFNGLYSLSRDGALKKELTIDNKYRPTRLYKLQN